MNSSHSRAIIAYLWAFFFFVNILILLWIYALDYVGEDNFNKALSVLNGSYVTYIGLILAFYYGTKKKSQQPKTDPVTPFAIAMICSLAWNLLISFFMVRLLFGGGSIESSTRSISNLAHLLSWIVAPAIGYYFSSLKKDNDKS
jgi:hypothetical protein